MTEADVRGAGDGRRLGVTTGDVVLALAALCIVAALALPAWRDRAFRAMVEQAEGDVREVAGVVEAVRAQDGLWPQEAPTGEISREGYVVGWGVWDVVDSVEAPEDDVAPTPGDAPLAAAGPTMLPVVRSIGAVTVRAGDTLLLAALARRFEPEASFVLDSTWVLVLPERGAARELDGS